MISLLSKVWHDLWSNKARTIQVVMVIALGAFGIGLVIGGRNLIAGTIADQWKQANPPNIKLGVTPPLTDDQLRALERIDGVYEAEGILNDTVEWRLVGETEWQTARLESRQDFTEQKMELVKLISGDWPNRNAIGVIKTADTLYGVGEGNTIEVRANGQERTYQINGTLKPIGPFPVVFLGQPIFYVDRPTFSRLTGRDTYDLIQTRDLVFSQAKAEATDLEIQAYFEDIGVDSVGVLFPFQSRIVPPDVPPAAELLNAIFLILGLIGVIIIILGIFLVYNSISAIMTQQVSQIGVMKAIGARPWQVLYGYTLLVLAYGILAAIVSIPIGSLGARSLQGLFINLLNLEDPGFTVDMAAISVQIGVSIAAPILAALLPLLNGIRITVREAVNSYGLSNNFGWVDRIVSRIKNIPYTLLLIVGNTFRNRRRAFFIQITLVLAGVIFMMVLGVNDATRYTFGDKLSSIHNYQISLRFDQFVRSQRVEKLASTNPQVTEAESWLIVPATARPASQDESEVTDPRISIFGLPATSQMYLPDLQEGRWLNSNDNNAAVVSQRLAENEGWQIGEIITLTSGDGVEEDWQIVGITYDPLADTAAFVPLTRLQRVLGATGQVNTLWTQTSLQDAASLERIAAELTSSFERRSLELTPTSTFGYSTITEIIEETTGGFSLIIQLLAIMAVVIAVVGGVGLSGVLTLNIIERRKEIGVMRSIGASNWRIIRMFMGEGMLLSWISWLIALPLSIPAAYIMATRGLSLALNQGLAYRFSPVGGIAWFIIISILAIIASAIPARGAARISVRESLSYQ
jgi:putative ABC transport system permease protein